jgi:hypothetical protein
VRARRIVRIAAGQSDRSPAPGAGRVVSGVTRATSGHTTPMVSFVYALTVAVVCFAVIMLLHVLDFDRDTLIAIIGGLLVGLLIAKEDRVLGWWGQRRGVTTRGGD